MDPVNSFGLARRISIIVPCFDAAGTLPACIAALRDQQIASADVEILVIDNNSRDETMAVAQREHGITLLHESTQSAYAARNKGLGVAKGDLLVFTDPDCVAQSDWLETLIAPLVSPSVKITIGRSLLYSNSLAMRTLQDYEHVRDRLILGGADANLYYGRTNNMVVRREVFDELGPFEERRRGADVICVRRCVDRWGPEAIQYVGDARVAHLEMDGLRTYFRKVLTYGWSHALYAQVVRASTASRSWRWALFERVGREFSYSLPRKVLLFVLMATEEMLWSLGRRRGLAADAHEPPT